MGQNAGKTNGHADDQPALTGGRTVLISLLGVDKVEFTKHADDQMRVRGITQDEVIRTLQTPQETGLPTQIMRNRVRRYRGRKVAVDVVYEMRPDRVIVITAILVNLK